MSFRFFQLFLFLAAGILLPVGAAESEAKSATGLKRIQLITDAVALTPGESFTIGLVFTPEPGYHVYWRGPGIVGVAPVIEWTLPEGFEAGPIEWPAPQKVDMAGIVANGFKSEVTLLTRIQCPDELKGDTVHIKAKCAWMACSISCHPGVDFFSLSLPVSGKSKPQAPVREITKQFENIRKALPPDAPESWSCKVDLVGKNQIDLTITIPDFPEGKDAPFTFFSDDMQVDSDKAMTQKWIDRSAGVFRLTFARPDFAPKSPPRFSGLLHSDLPFPELKSNWAEISVPWPPGTFSDE